MLANCVGVIDSDYRGEILVALKNTGPTQFVIHPGDRIAQLVFATFLPVEFIEVKSVVEDRGGFGSSGA